MRLSSEMLMTRIGFVQQICPQSSKLAKFLKHLEGVVATYYAWWYFWVCIRLGVQCNTTQCCDEIK